MKLETPIPKAKPKYKEIWHNFSDFKWAECYNICGRCEKARVLEEMNYCFLCGTEIDWRRKDEN